VENEYTAEKLVFSATFVPKNFHNRSKFDKVLTKISLHSFFETRCRWLRKDDQTDNRVARNW